jgi:hypothetical protein
MNYVLITVAVLLASYGIYKLVKRRGNGEVDLEVNLDVTIEGKEEKPEVLVKEEKKVQAVEETVEQMKERLNSIKSTDSEKPFASLSKPTASEIPTEMTTSEPEVTEVTEAPAETATVAPKAKKKRPYKKRAPKKEKEIKKED